MQVSRFPRAALALTAALLVLTLAAGCGTRGSSQDPQPGGSDAPAPQAPGQAQPSGNAPTQPTQPNAPGEPKEHPAPVGSSLIKENGIIIREFALTERPDNVEAFGRLPSDVWEDLNDSTHGIIDRWGRRLPALPDLNDAVERWGYSFTLEPDEFVLHKNDQVVASLYVRGLSRSADGRRTVFVGEGTRGGNKIFLDGQLKDWDVMGADFVPPIFVGNTLYSLVNGAPNVAGAQNYSIMKEDQTAPVYTFKADFYTDSPIHGFYSTGDGWVLEYAEHVVVNGEDLGAAHGYTKVFMHRQLAGGRFFYLFEKGGKVGMSFDGQTLTPQYDQVLHYQCCEPAIANPRSSDIAVRFFAQRDGHWYYVSALVPAD